MNWESTSTYSFSITIRGYTGHEHMNAFNLINMNGRAYDPYTSQFLSPDPFIQDPANPQNYNRYSYVLNNPLKFTDPSGYNYWGIDNNSGMMDWGNSADGWNNWQQWSYGMDAYYGRGESALGRWGGVEETANRLYDMGARPFGLTKRNGKLGVWIDYSGTKDSEYLDTKLSDGVRFGTETFIGSKFTTIGELYGSTQGRGMSIGGAGGGNNLFSVALNIMAPIGGAINVKNTLIDWGVRSSFKSANSYSGFKNLSLGKQNWRYENILTKTGFKYFKVSSNLGRGASIFNAGISIATFTQSDQSWGDYGQLGVGLLSSVLTYTPEPISTGFGISIGIIDACGGFNSTYNHLNTIEKTEMKYLNLAIFLSTQQHWLYLK